MGQQNFIQTGGGSGGGSGTVNSGTAGQMTYYAGTGTTVSGTANATLSSGALTLGVATSVQGQVLLSGATSGAVTVTGAAAAGTWTLTLPTTGGTNGYFLQTNGSGTTTWASAGGTTVTTPFTNYMATLNGNWYGVIGTANHIAVFPFTLPYAQQITNILIMPQNSDGTHLYDFGVYSTSGALQCHVGAGHVSFGSGVVTIAVSGGAVTLGPGTFLFAVTSNAATALSLSLSASGLVTAAAAIGSVTNNGVFIYDTTTTSSSGVLPSTITLSSTPTLTVLPATAQWTTTPSFAQGGIPAFMFT